MSNLICIIGYIEMTDCGHCGRTLRHGIVTDRGTVGGACFARKLTLPRQHNGKTYRLDPASIVHIAKAVQRAAPGTWDRYGVNEASRIFEAA